MKLADFSRHLTLFCKTEPLNFLPPSLLPLKLVFNLVLMKCWLNVFLFGQMSKWSVVLSQADQHFSHAVILFLGRANTDLTDITRGLARRARPRVISRNITSSFESYKAGLTSIALWSFNGSYMWLQYISIQILFNNFPLIGFHMIGHVINIWIAIAKTNIVVSMEEKKN